jgi:alpha-beta hydrolase superfamily lysophospholipase
MQTEKVSFESEGQNISGILHLPEQKNSSCVIASHGLLSSKDTEKYTALGERLAREGLAMLRFDFRGCGESEGRMEESTVSGRIADLGSAIEFVKFHSDSETRIGLLGSSLGGYISLMKASTEKKIRAVVIWATPFHLNNLKSKKSKEEMPSLGEVFFEDLPRHRLLPLLPQISNCLVIHGEEDELVPVNQAWEIFNSLGSPKEIHVIEDADHRLMNPGHRRRAIDLSVDWFKKYL